MSSGTIPAPPAPVNGAQPQTQIEEAQGALEADRLYGDGAPYDRDRLTAEVGHHLGQGVLAMLEAGKRLILLKEHETHGAWMPLLERIGIGQSVASKMMMAARKFLAGPNSELVPNLDSPTKVYELAMLDDDDLEELREGGTIANGVGLDDIQRMSPSELRSTLRAERQERKAREEAQRSRIAEKERRIEDGVQRNTTLQRKVQELQHPGSRQWTEAQQELREQIALCTIRARDVLSDTREAANEFNALAEHHDASLTTLRALLAELGHLVGIIGSEIDDIEGMVPPSIPDPVDDTEPLPF